VTPEETAAEFVRRRRARNWAVFVALLGLAVLFFFITVARRSAAAAAIASLPFSG
jgi:hypothetical protein